MAISGSVNNTTLVGWSAVSNNGEVWFSNQNFAAYEGNNYVELLQNINANTNTYWNETFISNTTAGYDRIVTEIAGCNYLYSIYGSSLVNLVVD